MNTVVDIGSTLEIAEKTTNKPGMPAINSSNPREVSQRQPLSGEWLAGMEVTAGQHL